MARKVKLRPWRDFDFSLGGPESAGYLSYKEDMTFRWAAVCLECYRVLDNETGRAAVGGREFNLAGASRFDKAAVVDDRKWQAFRRRVAARIGVDLDP